MSPLPPTQNNPAVLIDSLRVNRGATKVFTDLNLVIPRGNITGVLGPSGSGKTTLLRAIVGVQRIQGGTVSVLGQPAGNAALRHRIGYATQEASVYPDLTVIQNLHYFAHILNVSRTDVDRVIEAVDLQGQIHQGVSSLSGGQRSRVSLAVAMLGNPDLLVLDEPTVGLDPVLRADLWNLFRELASNGTTLIISSHVMDEAMRCDHLLLLRNGCLVAQTTPAGLLTETEQDNPEDAFLALIRREER
ncbi:MAG: ABC transporter ATP-binding protein [Thermomicrobiales bacterium]|nr:ABC transporter ATP-binding protein [Thermomicrobiales bacterium]MCO5228223.1 ABC transporter ATP-binding protein [Thermomicrobiales bacterium]